MLHTLNYTASELNKKPNISIKTFHTYKQKIKTTTHIKLSKKISKKGPNRGYLNK
jgi:hypothetical protein